MKTQVVEIQPPEELVKEVRRLKSHYPFRICWGAFNSVTPTESEMGADYTKRKFNKCLRQPNWVGFIV